MDQERVVVAEILRERGNRGELVARSLSDVPGRFESLAEAQVRMADGSDELVRIESVWSHKGDWVFKFDGVDSIDSARRYRGADLWLPSAERGRLADGEYFQSDLIGCKVLNQKTGEAIGIVTNLEECGGPALLQVKGESGEKLIPFVPAICVLVDVAARSISVDIPEGLLDL